MQGDRLGNCRSKRVVWKGPGELPQLPWHVSVSGTILLIDMWCVYGGATMALLALGVRVVVVALETDRHAVQLSSTNLQNIIHLGKAEEFKTDPSISIN